MSFTPDSVSLLSAVKIATETLLFLTAATGLILSLRFWSRGRSPRFAASSVGLVVLSRIAAFVYSRLAPASGWTFYTPYSTTEQPSIWLHVGFVAAVSIAAVGSALLMIAALWTAWRPHS